MSGTQEDVLKMVGIYKKLFLVLTIITILGIGITFLHMPVWLAIVLAFGIIAIKSKVVIDAFKHLLTGRNVLILTIALTGVFLVALLILPLLNHEGYITGTKDISKELQMQEKPAEGHHHGD